MKFSAVLLMASLAALPARAEDDLINAEEGWRPHVEQVILGNWVEDTAARDALTAPMIVCQGTACATVSAAQLNAAQAAQIRAIFTGGSDSPAGERALLAQAIARFETFVGAQNGTWRDHARNTKASHDEEGQMDCVSEATNTRTYLHRLTQAGLVAHHHVGGFVTRYLVLLQHVAVEITEAESGERYVIDSWDGENGEPPVIEHYGAWRMEFLV